jgi:hypothetical protein
MASKTIAMAAVAAGVVAALAVAFAYSPLMAMAQSSGDSNPAQSQGIKRSLTYFATDTMPVTADGNATAQAFCFNGDVLLTGGYTIGGFDSADELSSSILFSNTALRMENSTGTHEGWQAGLVNAGTGQLTITANAVCLDVTPETK